MLRHRPVFKLCFVCSRLKEFPPCEGLLDKGHKIMKKSQRRKFFVDSHVQGAIVVRVILYWASCVLFVAVPQIVVRTFFEPSRPFYEQFTVLWNQYWPVITATVVLGPFFIFDAIRMSNRFAGPIFKLRREMQRLAAGEKVAPIRFREGDFWQDLCVPFNQIAA